MDKFIERPKPEILKDAPPSVIIGFVPATNNKLDQGHGSLPKCLFRFAKNLPSFQFNLTRGTSGMPLFRSNPSLSQTSFLLIVNRKFKLNWLLPYLLNNSRVAFIITAVDH
jgi:hypothetical protein